ncbi:bifunctional cytochrome P450/NADPH--P450 reductase [Priestia endophytica]|uniref:bifunctional cytochrome P450/NADPH--P450 reductase n=1 Tax=Priestia endophytica TaxID=135735 RepID=UPI000F5307C6|nr:bifunctional cytochrome P450/NADPH--P450 reductase [Priestia endophytica]RPK15023.1 hypothetical protein FH5_00458 [Priestia endophytica]
MEKERTIPQPKTYGPLGSLPLMDKDKPMQTFMKIGQELGPIFQFQFPHALGTFVSGHDLVAEVCDEEKFQKQLGVSLTSAREFAGDGLFTSYTEEPNWKKAHNILLPSFSQRAMKGYHHMMLDIATQLVEKWERLNKEEEIDVPEDMTRLTLDTIGLCGFGYRFNSFYREGAHPFVDSMVRALDESMNKMNRLPIQDKLMVRKKRQFQEDKLFMFELADEIIKERKKQGEVDGDDLLAHMLNGKDPETGEKLDDENIRYQMITFLIAGHETTSGLLSFAIYYLLKNPRVLKKAYKEVDEVLTGIPTYEDVRKLKYVRMILNEALRLWPTAPAFSLYAKEDIMLGGKYPIEKNQSVSVLLGNLHRDKRVWGENVEEFRPERFQDEKKIPHHAYKPFGNGQRACIGQQFALHEATLVLGMILQRFNIVDHRNYELKVKETLTLKPDNFTIQVSPREREYAALNEHKSENKAAKKVEQDVIIEEHNTPLLVLHGSNLGTAEGIANELAELGERYGFSTTIASLNRYSDKLPTSGVVLIVSASYNGKAPDNATEFVNWLETSKDDLSGVHYAVFGCGDRNWASTYQRIPRVIDKKMAELGAERIVGRGEGDASGDFELHLDEWKNQLTKKVKETFNVEETKEVAEKKGLNVTFVKENVQHPLVKTYEAQEAEVLLNKELQREESGRSTRHIEISLPNGVSYKEGDHLGILPQNSAELVNRVLKRYGLDGSESIMLEGDAYGLQHLPLNKPVRVRDVLTFNVELQEPVSRKALQELAEATVCPPHKYELEALLGEHYSENVTNKRLTMLSLLEKYEACELSFERFLTLCPPLKPRYYSISSSPLKSSQKASITVSVVEGKAWSGDGMYHGVASSYLAQCQAGEKVMMFINTPQSRFELPADESTPLIMVGPGTGVAPFRGFLQARSVLKEEGKILGEAHLYFGCRNEAHDFIYKDELEKAESDGIVTLHTAFSRMESCDKTYVQHLLEQDAAEVISILVEKEGALYICGDGKSMAPAVESTLKKAYQDIEHKSEEEAERFLLDLEEQGRFAKDVWAG